jgi:hypothetical protein
MLRAGRVLVGIGRGLAARDGVWYRVRNAAAGRDTGRAYQAGWPYCLGSGPGAGLAPPGRRRRDRRENGWPDGWGGQWDGTQA